MEVSKLWGMGFFIKFPGNILERNKHGTAHPCPGLLSMPA